MSKSHEVMFYTDGRHTSTYLYEPPMSIEQYLEPIDEVLDLGIDTIVYETGGGPVVHYATDVGERWGHNVDLVDTAIWYRAGLNLKSAVDRDIDPLALICKYAQDKGFQFIPSFFPFLRHRPKGRVTDSRVSNFEMDHPEWQVGPEDDFPESKHDDPSRLSFSVPEVREGRLRVIKELVSKYPTDGIEINLLGGALPLIARREVTEHTETITQWMTDIRAICNQAAQDQSRAKRLVVRIAATLPGSIAMGMDIDSWIHQGLVDTIIAVPVVGGYESDVANFRQIVEAARGTDVKIMGNITSQGKHETREVTTAAACNIYAAGGDGVFFPTYYPHPGRYPYDDAALGRLRLLGHPETLRYKDKSYRIVPPERDNATKFGEKDQLPAYPNPGDLGPEITIDVSDNFNSIDVERLWRCELRVMIQNMVHHDRVRLVWNGEPVDDNFIRIADWTYNIRPHPDHAVLGYRLHVDLKEVGLPLKGSNTVRLDIIEKDAKLVHPISVAEVEIVVQYLPHRHGVRNEERFPGYET